MVADADADDDQDSRCSASQYVQVRPPEPRILFQNRSYLSLTVRGYTTQSAFCNLGVVIMVVVVIVTMLDDFSPHDPFSEMFHLTIFSSPSSGRVSLGAEIKALLSNRETLNKNTLSCYSDVVIEHKGRPGLRSPHIIAQVSVGRS